MKDRKVAVETVDKDKPTPKNTYQTGWRIIGVSGDTIDGREISADTLKQMAADYNPKIYGARINIEHQNYWWDSGGLGDVLALKTEAWEQDPSKTALLAQLLVFPEMQSLWDGGRKIYTSMEILPNFANTKRPYLVGLAITDTPASLGTTANFSAAQNHAKDKHQVVSHYREMQTNQPKESQMTVEQIKNEATQATLNSASADATNATEPEPKTSFTALHQQYYQQPESELVAHKSEIESLAKEQGEAAQLFANMLQDHENTKAKLAELEAKFAALQDKLEKEAFTGERKPHIGDSNQATQGVW